MNPHRCAIFTGNHAVTFKKTTNSKSQPTSMRNVPRMAFWQAKHPSFMLGICYQFGCTCAEPQHTVDVTLLCMASFCSIQNSRQLQSESVTFAQIVSGVT